MLALEKFQSQNWEIFWRQREMGGEGEHQSTRLLTSSSSSAYGSEESFNRRGSAWTAMAHIITGVIGAGVLALAWSIAQLGWLAGPLSIVLFAAITLVSTFLLCDCYRTPDPEYGHTRNNSYTGAVLFYLGEKSSRVCGVFVQESLYGCGIAYTITAAISMRYAHPTPSPLQVIKNLFGFVNFISD